MLPNFVIEIRYHAFQILYKGASPRKSPRNMPLIMMTFETSRGHSRILVFQTLGIQFNL